MDTRTAIRTRRSVRHFQDRPVSRQTLEAIVDAGRLAASGGGLQPWEFVVVTDAATRARLAELSPYGRFLATAPAAIVVLYTDASPYGKEDCCSATATMLLAIHDLGLGACWVVTDDEASMLACLGAPGGAHVGALIALGHPEITPDMPDKRPLRDVLHWERF
ncbi:MAG TPA: nitroreductase family protein [Armatimonadota bacterium]|nr:nitroreductase family protein [Armatimonadota bacterium]HOS44118.1 nitroreductase family protein [Armatimonadota bacterium]